MKKTLKVILLLVLVLLIVIAGSIAILLASPGAQTSLVKRFLPEEISIEKVHLGFSGLHVERIAVIQDDMDVRVAQIRGEFPLLRTLVRRHVDMSELMVSGVKVDLSRIEPVVEPPPEVPYPPRIPPPEPPPEPEPDVVELPWEALAAFDGLFREDIMWPPVAIGVLSADAVILLPGGGREVKVQLAGENLRADGEPQLRADVEYDDTTEEAVLRHAALHNTLTLSLASGGIIKGARLDSRAEADVRVEEARESHVLNLLADLRQKDDASGETYALTITLDPDGDPQEVASLNARYAYDNRAFGGDWVLALDTRAADAMIEPVLQGAWGTVRSDGSFDINPAAERFAARGEATVRAEQLDLVQPELETVPTFLLETEFDLAGADTRIEVKALRAELFAPADTLLVALHAEQPFGFDLATGEPDFGDPGAPLLRLALSGLPVDLVNAFLPDMRIALASLSGEMLVRGTDEDIHLETSRPLTLQGFHFEQHGQPLLEDLTLVLAPSISYRADQMTFDLGSLELSRDNRLLLDLAARGFARDLDAEEPYFELSTEWDAMPADLLAQPVAEPFRNLSEGRMTGLLNASGVASDIKADLELVLAELVLADDGRRINSVTLNADVQVEDTPHIRMAGPMSVRVGEENTDLELDMGLWPGDETLRVEVKGQGDKVFVEHFQWLADAFQNPDYVTPETEPEVEEEPVAVEVERPDVEERVEEEEPEPRPHDPEMVPVWAGLLAEADVNIAELILPGAYNLRELLLRARVEEDAARLDAFEARLGDSPAKAKGALVFRADQPARPYGLDAEFSLQDFDVGAYLRDVDPDTKPALEAVVSVNGQASAEAPSLEALPDYLVGEFSAQASEGVLRALRRGAVTGTIDVVGQLGRLGARLAGHEESEAVTRLVTYFNAIEFDEFTLEARRNTDWTIDLTHLLVRNPELRIAGRGHVGHEEGREFHQQPIELTLNMAARRPLASLLDELRLLEEEPDDEGYRPFKRKVEVRGNVGEPDPRPLWEIILESGARRLLDRDEREDRERRDIPVDDIRRRLGI